MSKLGSVFLKLRGSLAILAGFFVGIRIRPEGLRWIDVREYRDRVFMNTIISQRCGPMSTFTLSKALIRKAIGRFVEGLVLTLAMSGGLLAEEDPYLSAISKEADKVEAETQPTLNVPTESSGQTDEDGLSLQAFEEDLKTRHKGSYTFYQKLPRRSREEVFQEYRNGASIDELRKTIMERFLHR